MRLTLKFRQLAMHLNRFVLLTIGGVFFIVAYQSVFAYEIDTHSEITRQAYIRSNFANQFHARRLGLDWGIQPKQTKLPGPPEMTLNDQTADLGFFYSDFQLPLGSGTEYDRRILGFEQRVMSGQTGVNGVLQPRWVIDWFMRGAVREDDNALPFWPKQPYNDPHGNINRMCRHFYDPLFKRGFSPTDPEAAVVCGNSTSAVQWAFDADQELFGPRLDGKRNHFGIQAARDAQWRALTGAGFAFLGTGGSSSGGATYGTGEGRSVRNKYLATMFYSLGSVMHLTQDMGNPQHTRNEAHPLGAEGVLEAFTNARVRRDEYVLLDPVTNIATQKVWPAPIYTGYATPRFDKYSDFFSTVPGSPASGKGLADYSNRGFFTTGTLLTVSQSVVPNPYPNPPREFPSSNYELQKTQVAEPRTYRGKVGNKVDTYVGVANAAVKDTVTGETNSIPMFVESTFASPLKKKGIYSPGGSPPANLFYGLSLDVYLAQTDLLIPRAVAYSSGLLDYYFRGVLKVEKPLLPFVIRTPPLEFDDRFGVEVQNRSKAYVDDESLASGPATEALHGGNFVLIYRYYKPENTRVVTSKDGYLVRCVINPDDEFIEQSAPVAASLAPDEKKIIVFKFRKQFARDWLSIAWNIDVAQPGLYSSQLLYRGRIGNEEDGIAMSTVGYPVFLHDGIQTYGDPNARIDPAVACSYHQS